MRAGVKGVATLFDDTQQKAEYEDRLEGLVLFDPLPFDGIENIDDLTLREAAVWGCVYSVQEEPREALTTEQHGPRRPEQLLLPLGGCGCLSGKAGGPQLQADPQEL